MKPGKQRRRGAQVAVALARAVVKGRPLVPAATSGEKLGCVHGRAGKYTDQLIFSSTGLR